VQGLQVAQLAACNRLHTVKQRLARWLFVSDDKVSLKGFPITHHSLAQVLDSGRPSITIAAGALQKSGLIDYKGSRMTILDRKRLEGAACECYQAMKLINE
jgi:CRP-like cAMP-binding protein